MAERLACTRSWAQRKVVYMPHHVIYQRGGGPLKHACQGQNAKEETVRTRDNNAGLQVCHGQGVVVSNGPGSGIGIVFGDHESKRPSTEYARWALATHIDVAQMMQTRK
jgi:hypothetical protein